VLTICVSYVVLRVWPRHHYPRLFAFLAGVATVSGLYVFKVPGAAFGLGALAIFAYLAVHVPESIEALFQKDDKSATKLASSRSASTPSMTTAATPFWPVVFGTLIGVVLSVALVAAMVMPPAYLTRWIASAEPVGQRIERGLNPGDQWTALSKKEREASEGVRRNTAELADVKKRLADTEAALAKAQDELGMVTANTVKGIRIAEKSGSRHANGSVYIGVETAVPSGVFCSVNVSSDKVDRIQKNLRPGEAIPIASAKGKFRVVLTGLDSRTCVFDLVKD
jgi:hypothetical protein